MCWNFGKNDKQYGFPIEDLTRYLERLAGNDIKNNKMSNPVFRLKTFVYEINQIGSVKPGVGSLNEKITLKAIDSSLPENIIITVLEPEDFGKLKIGQEYWLCLTPVDKDNA